MRFRSIHCSMDLGDRAVPWAGLVCLILLIVSASTRADDITAVPNAAPDTKASAEPGAGSNGLLEYHKHELGNGLVLYTIEDFSAPIVNVQLWYHVGSKDEDPQRQGFAHMFEHMMFRGSNILGPTDHFQFIRQTGGTTNAYTSFDQTVYHETLPAEALELALWLEAERMAFLKIDQDAFDTERKIVEEERRLGLNQPYGSIPEQLLAAIYRDHPYRWSPIGQIPHLRAASVPELRAFWTKHYVPNNATLVVAGAVHHEEVVPLVERYFGWIPRYPDPERVTVRDPLPKEPTTIRLSDKSAPLAVVGLGWRTVPLSHPDRLPLELLASILGGGLSSDGTGVPSMATNTSNRLYRELVADSGLAVFAVSGTLNLEQDGMFVAGAALPPVGSSTSKVERALRDQVARLRDEPVSEAELAKAKKQVRRSLVTRLLTVESKASALGSAAVLEGDEQALAKSAQRLDDITRDDLLRVAKAYLTEDKVYEVTVQPNLLGTLLGRKPEAEEEAPITAEPERFPPPPGRAGLSRPETLPQRAPLPKVDALASAIEPAQVTRFELENGLRVLLIEDRKLPFISALIGLRGGGIGQEPKPGTASLALDLLTKGTKHRSEAELAEQLDALAIRMGGSPGVDASSFGMSSLSEDLDPGLELLADVIFQPAFPEEELKKLKGRTRASLALAAAQPAYQADKVLREKLFGSHHYARSVAGEPADVDRVSRDDILAYWETASVPADMTLIVAGDVTPEVLRPLVEKHFGVPARPSRKKATEPPSDLWDGSRHIYIVDKPGAIQSQIRVGQLGPAIDADEYAITKVISAYFGGAFDARLNETIRVQKGLTYGARGGFSADSDLGRFTVSTFTKTESTAETVRVIFDELARLRDEPPSDVELDRNRRALPGSLARQRETPQQIAEEVWTIERHALPSDHVPRLLNAMLKAGPGDCMRVIRSTVDPSRTVVVVVGDASKIADELGAIAPVTVLGKEGS